MTFNKTYYLSAIRENATRFAEAARVNLEAQIPSCPEWTARDLVIHLGNVYTFWAGVGGSRAQTVEDAQSVLAGLKDERDHQENDPALREADSLLSWFDGRLCRLESVVEDLNPDESMWTWARAAGTAAFIPRRMGQETAVHRWDMERAQNIQQPIDPGLAKDGIDELMDVFYPEVVDDAEVPGRGETFHFHRTDGEGEWLVRFDPDKTVVTREHGKGDLAVRGSASDLLLFLWGRQNPDSQLEFLGDTALVERYGELLDLS